MMDSIFTALRIGFPVDLIIKATLVLASAGGVALVLSRSSAATRHLVWSVGVAALLLLPLLALVLPTWEVPLESSSVAGFDGFSDASLALSPGGQPGENPPADEISGSVATGASPSVTTSRDAVPPSVVIDNGMWGIGWMPLLFAAWALGALLLILRLAIGWIGIRRLSRNAEIVTDPEWRQLVKDAAWMLDVDREVLLVRSERASMPMTWGTRRPTILIPTEAEAWSIERRRVVLLHEMAHVARRDCLTQSVADLACALYWFHPLAWVAVRRLRTERERACDDRVLAAGERASDYAGHLLEVARAYRGQGVFSAAAIAMARPSQLEGRLLAVLDGARRRAAPGRRELMIALAVASFILVPLAAIRTVEAQIQSSDESFLVQLQSAIGASAAGFIREPTDAGMGAVNPANLAVDTVIELGLPALPGGTVRLDLDTGGNVRVVGWDRDSVSLNAVLRGTGAENTRVYLEGRNGTITLATEYSGRRNSNGHRFELRIPSRSNVQVTSGGGDVRIEEVAGEFSGSTGGGNIRLHRLTGSANMTTGGGDINVTDSQLDGDVTTGGGDVTVANNRGSLQGRTGGGDVRIQNVPAGASIAALPGQPTRIHTGGGDISLGELPGGADLSTGGGDISVASANGRVIARTGGGNITLRRVVGPVDAQTGGGDVSLGSVAGPAVVRTGGGDVEITLAEGAGDRHVDIASGSGSVTLDLPADFSGEYEILIDSRDPRPQDQLRSDVPLSQEIRPNGSNTILRATGRTGSGSNRVIVRTSAGEVRIRRGGRAATLGVSSPVAAQRPPRGRTDQVAVSVSFEEAIQATVEAAIDEDAIARWANNLARVTIDSTVQGLERAIEALEEASLRGELDAEERDDLRELREGLREFREDPAHIGYLQN